MAALSSPSSVSLPTVWLKRHGSAERSFARALQAYFQEQASRIADAGENFPGLTPDAVAAIFQADAEHEILKPIIRRNLSRLMVQGAVDELAAVERRKDAKDASDPEDDFRDQQLPQRTRDAIRAALDELEGQDYWQAIQAETKRNLTSIIEKGIADKLGNYAMGMLLRKELGGMASNKRAQKIARTEVTACLNAGHVASMEELADAGLIAGKQWNAIGDRDVRADHALLQNVVVPPRADFSVGGWAVPYPGHWGLPAEQRINCRCGVFSMLDTSIVADA